MATGRATASGSRRAFARTTRAAGSERRRSPTRRNSGPAQQSKRPEESANGADRVAALGSLHPLEAGSRAQALRKPARRRREAGGKDGARRLYSPPGRRIDLGRAVERDLFYRPIRQPPTSTPLPYPTPP